MIYAVIILYILVAFLWFGTYNSNKVFSKAVTNLHTRLKRVERR